MILMFLFYLGGKAAAYKLLSLLRRTLTRFEVELIKIDSNGKRIFEIDFNGKKLMKSILMDF